MTNQEKLAFRVLASIYPDSKPSQIRKIIEKAIKAEVSEDDIQMWDVLTRTGEPEPVRIVEHHYHETPLWYPAWYESKPYTLKDWTITCNPNVSNTFACSDGNSSSVTIDVKNCILEELGVY